LQGVPETKIYCQNVFMNKRNKPGTKSGPTGPKTEQGKAISSQNALIHGATAKRWLSPAENESYQCMLAELTKHYPTTNPLLKMQFARISWLRVHLERIMELIDASFESAKVRARAIDQVGLVLDMSEDEKKLAGSCLWGSHDGWDPKATLDPKIDEIAHEIEAVGQIGTLTTHEDFALNLPQFCEYITNQARQKRVTLDEFLSSRMVSLPTMERVAEQDRGLGIHVGSVRQGRHKASEIADLKSVSVQTLQRSALWFQMQRVNHQLTLSKLDLVKPIFDVLQAEVTPDFDKLDCLMRYQTAISRQLSTAVGELLVLTKRKR
jgi:hypothetical protein